MPSKNREIENRIARLERSNRLLMIALFVGLCAVTISMTLADKPDQTTIRAQGFIMMDSTGAVRGELSMRDGSPALYLKDEAGTDRVILIHDANQTALYLLDKEGDTRVGTAQFAHGGGGFALHGPKGKGAAVLYLKQSGSLRLFDTEGAVTAEFPTPEKK